MSVEDYLRVVRFNPDKESHIRLVNDNRCLTCSARACLYICPSSVYSWNEREARMEIFWQRCLECGACAVACPRNIEFQFPRGGFGVSYHI